MAATATDPRDLKFASDGSLRWFSPEPTVEYGFCSNCGSSMFWRIVGTTDSMSICAGVLNPPTGLRTVTALWLDDASDYAEPSPGIRDRRPTE